MNALEGIDKFFNNIGMYTKSEQMYFFLYGNTDNKHIVEIALCTDEAEIVFYDFIGKNLQKSLTQKQHGMFHNAELPIHWVFTTADEAREYFNYLENMFQKTGAAIYLYDLTPPDEKYANTYLKNKPYMGLVHYTFDKSYREGE